VQEMMIRIIRIIVWKEAGINYFFSFYVSLLALMQTKSNDRTITLTLSPIQFQLISKLLKKIVIQFSFYFY